MRHENIAADHVVTQRCVAGLGLSMLNCTRGALLRPRRGQSPGLPNQSLALTGASLPPHTTPDTKPPRQGRMARVLRRRSTFAAGEHTFPRSLPTPSLRSTIAPPPQPAKPRLSASPIPANRKAQHNPHVPQGIEGAHAHLGRDRASGDTLAAKEPPYNTWPMHSAMQSCAASVRRPCVMLGDGANPQFCSGRHFVTPPLAHRMANKHPM